MLPQKVLGNIRRDPPRLIFAEQLGRRSSAWLFLEIDVGELLAAAIAQVGSVTLGPGA